MHGHLPQNSQGKLSCMASCPWGATQRASRSKAHRAKEAQIRAVFKRCKPEPQCQQSVPPTLPHLRATQRASISKAHKAREAQIRAVFKRCKPEPQTHLPQDSRGKWSCMATCPRILGASGYAWPLAPEFSGQVVMHGELPLRGPPKGHPEAKHTEPKKLKSVRFSSGVNPNPNVNKLCSHPPPSQGHPKSIQKQSTQSQRSSNACGFQTV